MALAGVKGHQPDQALLGFYASMEHLCSVAGPLLNHISLSAIITATAQMWTSAQANSRFKLTANMAGLELNRFYCSTLLQLEPKLPDVGAREISNILWSSAKLGLNPDAAVPGMTDALAAKLLQLTKDEARRQPRAQNCANSLWALATLGHEPADKGLVDAVCNHFAMLIKHHDAQRQPNAQESANVIWALASLSHTPADKGLVDAVCDHFVTLIKHHDAQRQPSSQGVSTVLWALGELNHAPSDGAASAILEWLIRLCKLPGQQPNAQELSNTLFACAVLHLKVKEHVSLALVDGLLRIERASDYEQAYCNAAWSLAVSGMLSSEILHALLERLQPLPTAKVAHDALPSRGLRQLYQALDSLQPLPSVAAQQLQDMLSSLGQRPLPDRERDADSSVSRSLGLALGQLGLAFAPDIPLSGYWANAVLQPRDGVTNPIVVAIESSQCFNNTHGRCARHQCASHFLCSISTCSCLGCMRHAQTRPVSMPVSTN